MKMPQDQIERLAALGYTEPEARFLYVVATHSGYFTMRQFNTFTGVSRGKRSMAFAQKLLKHAHATVRDYMGTGSVFHLFSRLVYGPIDKDNVRNRRRHSFDYIRTRLVQMDFLLENQRHDFLETENDKVNLFCESQRTSYKIPVRSAGNTRKDMSCCLIVRSTSKRTDSSSDWRARSVGLCHSNSVPVGKSGMAAISCSRLSDPEQKSTENVGLSTVSV